MLLKQDYRDLKGRFDKLVSIEMIEAVGWRYYDTFFRKCSELLKPHGVACIQAITTSDRDHEVGKRSVDFIKRYIFPGSCIPSIGAMAAAVGRATNMSMVHLEDITAHYATTLRAWYDVFGIRRLKSLSWVSRRHSSDVGVLLCYCEAGFRERTIGDVQILLAKPEYRGAPPLGTL